MATAADIRAQIAEKQRLLDDQQERLNYLQDQTERTKRIYEQSAIALAKTPANDPNRSRLQAEAQAEGVAYQQALQEQNTYQTNVIEKTSNEINTLSEQLATADAGDNKKKKTEDTTVDPKTDPTVDKTKRPYTVYFDDGSSIYYNPQTGEEIVTTIDANGVARTTSRIIIPQDSKNQAAEVDGGPTPINPIQESIIGPQAKDWRFRMSLAPSADYLYMAPNPGILAPLRSTDGVLFPYTPSINIVYTAGYNAQDLTHSNYKIYTYKSSAVEAINITGDFTAQDSVEANYLLAVIHFFKSVTKMFYGQDQNPSRGVPPPLVYLRGFGQYQFDWHPAVISSFTHTFPQDVDFVDAYPTNNGIAFGAKDLSPYERIKTSMNPKTERIKPGTGQIQPGGLPPAPKFLGTENINESTRVPTKVTIQLTCLPIVTRNAISNKFSLKEYATGQLMKGSVNAGTGGGIW
jgi:hypothetical protein